MAEIVKAWQCIGCGRIEAPRPCIGICQDRMVEFVPAADHRQTLARVDALAALVRQLAWTKPREGEWQRSFLALQAQARELLATLGNPGTP